MREQFLMPDLPNDPAEAAQLLRQWAADDEIIHVRMGNADLIRLADMLDPIRPAPEQAPKWDDPDPPMAAPADAKRPICQVCGVPPQSDDPCGYDQCPALFR